MGEIGNCHLGYLSKDTYKLGILHGMVICTREMLWVYGLEGLCPSSSIHFLNIILRTERAPLSECSFSLQPGSSCRPSFQGACLTPLLGLYFSRLPWTLPTCRVGDRERHAVLLSRDRARVVASAGANPYTRQAEPPTAKATPCCLPQHCFCGKNDNKTPLAQTQSLDIVLGFHSETSGAAESTCHIGPSAVDQVCLLKGLTQNSLSENTTLCRS